MKRLRFSIFLLIFALAAASPVEAQKGDPSLTEQVRRQTFFNNVTDTVATFGRSKAEKNRIIRQRKEARRIDRLKKIHTRRKAQHQKKQKERQKEIQRALRSNSPG